MKINIGLTSEQRTVVAEQLHALLADEYVLYTKTRKAHWNVTGPHFMSYHKLFEGQYEQLAETVDAVAERSLMLGIKVPATLLEFSQLTRLNEAPGENLDRP
jgi:starvation-inducible DNA-binding protein